MVLALAMVLTAMGVTVVSAASYSDTQGHWAESYINTWSDNGVIQGDGGYFRPDDAITRAEVAQVTQNVISYVNKAANTFTDVSASDWYADAILKLAAAGALTGNGDGTMSPNNYMTREEAMTMLARAYGLTVENSQAGITQYADYQNISDYATGYVGAMTAESYVGGYEDGTIRPKDYISRAEFVKILDNMIKLYITEPGSYGSQYVGGLVMIKTGGVTLSGIIAKGMVVSPQVNGDVTIMGSQVSGNIINLSSTANVTSNSGNVVSPNASSNPNVIINGNNGGSNSGGGTSANTVTVKFYYGDNYGTVKTKSVTKGKKLSQSAIPTPKESNWDGLWYTSKAAAEKCSGTTFDPSVSAVNKNYNLYAGHISSSDLTDVEIAVGNKTDYVNVYVGDTLTAANLAPAAAKNYVSYQWYRASESHGTGEKISGATKSSYTATEADKGKYLKVVVTGDGNKYNGTIYDVSSLVLAKDAPSVYPERVTVSYGNDASTTLTLSEGMNVIGVADESGKMLNAEQYTYNQETGKLTISKDYFAGLTDGLSAFTIIVSEDAVYNPMFMVSITGGPTAGPVPTEEPEPTATVNPSEPTEGPTEEPVATASPEPTEGPTEEPVVTASPEPTVGPTEEPVVTESPEPTEGPTEEPVVTESPEPTEGPTEEPVVTASPEPTEGPTEEPVVTSSPEPTEGPTDEPVATATASPIPSEGPTSGPVTSEVWNFNDIAGGTSYNTGDTISNANGKNIIVNVAEADTIMPTVKVRADGDNYLEFNDTTTAGTAKQDGWSYAAESPMDGDRFTAELDFKKGDTLKDTILMRFFDTNNADANNTYSSDGRVFELKTADKGALAIVDYFSVGSDNKAVSVPISGFTYSPDKWYGVKVEYTKADNIVSIYTKNDGEADYTLRSSIELGYTGGTKKVDTVPQLAINKVGAYTPGGGSAVLGVDNIAFKTKTYIPQDINVTGKAYTIFSNDLKNSLEPYDNSINAVLAFTKSGESEPYATAVPDADGNYNVSLFTGETYDVSVISGGDGYTFSPKSTSYSLPVVVDEPSKNVLFMKNREAVPYADTVYVGSDKEYKDINQAMASIRTMTGRVNEDLTSNPVTIVLDPGTYYGQVIVDVPNITIKSADESNPAVVSNYYGIGYVYYSMGSNNYYDADCAAAKDTKNTATRWGATIRITADNFLAENIDFENTFNQYVTDAEIADGVEPGGPDKKNFTRKKGTKVTIKDSTERAAAVAIDADNVEFYRCKMVSSQDTLYTGGTAYLKECDILGNTDYIFGGNSVVFENCNLTWYGYSDKANGGYISACKTSSETDPGYFFTGCTVKNSNISGMKFAPGGFGRNWGGARCAVFFNDVTLDGVSKPNGWTKMGGELSTSKLYVNYVHNINSTTDLTADRDNPNDKATEIPSPEDYFYGWTPVHYFVAN